MVVIVIVSILIGLLLPALFGARRRVQVAQVKAEITRLESAIAAFKARFGVEPPSSITFWERSSETNARNRGIIRRIWPQFDFTSNVSGFGNFGNVYDFDYDGTVGEANTSVTLNGAECLVFFLGGIWDPNNGAFIGFSKNPTNPFTTDENREGPFFDFQGNYGNPPVYPPVIGGNAYNASNWTGRLRDSNNNRFAEYLDPFSGQTSPYLYLSSYESRGYITTVPTPPAQTDPIRSGDLPAAMMFDAYRQTPNRLTVSPPVLGVPHKANSFQIISPGADGKYGAGGYFDAKKADQILIIEDVNGNNVIDPGEDINGNGRLDDRREEWDNITNFHGGALKP
jgi:type II secretory pathway pseudopilin PulG